MSALGETLTGALCQSVCVVWHNFGGRALKSYDSPLLKPCRFFQYDQGDGGPFEVEESGLWAQVIALVDLQRRCRTEANGG